MKKKYFILFLLIYFVTYSSDIIAQVPCPNPGPGPCNPPGAPIDGGIGFLIALGLGYAIKKIRDYKK